MSEASSAPRKAAAPEDSVVGRQGALYLALRLGTAAVSAAMIAVYTRYLTPAEYGLYALVMSIVQLVFLGTMLWICSTIVRFLAGAAAPVTFFTSIVALYPVLLLAAVPVLAALWLAFGRELPASIFELGFLGLASQGWIEIQLRVTTALMENRRLTAVMLVRTAVTAGSSAGLVVAGWGTEGMLLGVVLGNTLPAVWLTFANRALISPRAFRWRSFKDSCRYGIPLSVSFGLEAATSQVDRLLLGWLGGPAAVGLYAIGLDIADKSIRVLVNPLGVAAFPIFARAAESGRGADEKRLGGYFVVLVALGAAAALGLVGIAPTLSRLLVGAEFRRYAVPVITILSFATLISALKANYLDYAFQLGRRTGRSIVISLMVLATSATLSLLLTPRFGALGAATASLGTCSVGFLAALFLGRVAYRLPLPLRELAKIGFAGAAMLLTVRCFPGEGAGALAVQIAGGGGAYVALLLAFNLAGARDRVEPLLARAVRGAA